MKTMFRNFFQLFKDFRELQPWLNLSIHPWADQLGGCARSRGSLIARDVGTILSGLRAARIQGFKVAGFHAATAPSTHTSALRSGHANYIMRRFEIDTFLENIEKYKIPSYFYAISVFPRNDNQKVDRKKIKEII